MDGGGVKLLDGSFASQLARHVGEEIDGHPLWSARFLATHPGAVVETHLDYLRAGADVIETNTYQANVQNLRKHLGLGERDANELIKSAVDLAEEAVAKYRLESDREVLIAGAVGPYGVALHDGSEYSGSYIQSTPMEAIEGWHRPRIRALVEAGVDLLALETQPSAEEAAMLARLLREFPGAKAWVSFSCGEGARTAHGDDFREAVRLCHASNPEQIVAVGVNCLPPSRVEEMLRRVDVDVALVAYPNSGEKYDEEVKGWKNDRDDITKYTPRWLEMGVKYVGGCCRVEAEEVKAIGEEVDRWRQSQKKIEA